MFIKKKKKLFIMKANFITERRVSYEEDSVLESITDWVGQPEFNNTKPKYYQPKTDLNST